MHKINSLIFILILAFCVANFKMLSTNNYNMYITYMKQTSEYYSPYNTNTEGNLNSNADKL